MKKVMIALLLVVGLLLATSSVAIAGTSSDVTVTAYPSYISFNSSPTTWTLNGIIGSGTVEVNTTYYSNPLGDTTSPSATVADGECQFTWANDSSVNLDIFVNCGSFTGGDADMVNSNTGSNDATHYGAYSWYSGMTYSGKIVVKSSGSDALYTTSTPGEDKKWGAEITTRTNSWVGTNSSAATMTISAAAT